MGQLQICEAHVRHPCDADMGLFSWLPHGRENTLQIKTGKEKNEMKWRKTVAALSLLLAGCICLSACGGGTAEPSPSSEAEEAPYSAQSPDTSSVTELSDEQQEALDDWLWYERGDYTSENWYHIGSDSTVEMHGEYGSTEDTYTVYPMKGTVYNMEGFDIGPDDVPFLSLQMEENVFNSVEIIEDGRAFLTGNASSFPSYYIRSDYTDDEDLHNACVLMYRQWRLDEEHLYLNFYPQPRLHPVWPERSG